MSLGQEFSSEDDLDCLWLNHGTIFLYTPSSTRSAITKTVVDGKTAWGIPLAMMAQRLKLPENSTLSAACAQQLTAQGIFEAAQNGERELRIAFRATVNDNDPVTIGSRPTN